MRTGAILSGMRTPLKLTSLLALCGVLLIPSASAQTVQDIISKVDAAQKAAKDISFRLSGSASLESSPQKIDFTVKSIPAQNVARLQFNAPDALADNIVVADKNEIRQYLFLTNQVTVTSTKKAADSAGFGGLDFTQLSNTASLLSQYNVKLLSTTGAAGKRLFQLEATPKNGNSTDKTRVFITEAGWRPTRVQIVSSAGKSLADLNVSNYKINSGLSVAGLKQLPKDAEIVRQ
ncbi:outer membrane lipoprotein carrier protein LolA [Deinococcus radiopugnans ATCC 19172]|uniref:Outer membrane lipoprotein carrier protein LolA n=2 Tax=Deinococcus radiopugnans ATCC 19172 TaxID=585398 RepID=A0A5C4XVU3_9DEIO|nr:outer membrane lipoprotein carrier protein LolA [Deinococcus radiopugnans ATCC 19172]